MAPLRSILKASGFLYYTWVIPGAIFVIICLLSFLPFIRHLPAKTRRLFLICGTLFVGGALDLEIVTGYHDYLYGKENLVDVVMTTVEEFLEMLGIVVFIYALLSYISSYMKDMDLRVRIIDDRKQRQRVK
jgi:RsiW-degrading membrane proteinase PrsW (M82 family)